MKGKNPNACLFILYIFWFLLTYPHSVKTYESMTLEELEENEDEFNEEDERAIEMYRLVPPRGTVSFFVWH